MFKEVEGKTKMSVIGGFCLVCWGKKSQRSREVLTGRDKDNYFLEVFDTEGSFRDQEPDPALILSGVGWTSCLVSPSILLLGHFIEDNFKILISQGYFLEEIFSGKINHVLIIQPQFLNNTGPTISL